MNWRAARFSAYPSLLCLWLAAGGVMARAWQAPALNPQELVRKAVANEVGTSTSNINHMFRIRKITRKGEETREYVETREGTVGMLVALNGQPLTPDQRQKEEARLDRLIRDPQELRRKIQQQKEDSQRVTRMVKALPDAFTYQLDGTETGKDGHELVRLKFRPDPDYDPPTRELQVFTGMAGSMVIDANQDRIAAIHGTLFRDVNFGWGILGHLDKGGQFIVEQVQIPDGTWQTTRMLLSFTGKALFFHSINIKSTEISSNFRRVADNLTFAQGVQLLKKQDGVVAENQGEHEQN